MQEPSTPKLQDTSVRFSWLDLFRALSDLLGKRRKSFYLWTALLVATQAFVLLPPFIVGQIVDFFTHFSAGQSLTRFYFLVAGLGILMALVAYVRLTAKDRLSSIQINTIYETKVRGFERLMDFSIAWHHQENTGNKVQKIIAGTTNMRQFMRLLSQDIPDILVAFVGITAIFLFLNIKFAFIFMIYLACFSMIEVYFYQKMKQANEDFLKASEKSSGTYFEAASNILTIKSLGAKESVAKSVDKSEQAARDHAYYQRNLSTKKWQVFQVLNAFTVTSFLLLLGKEVSQGNLSAGSIFVYFIYVTQMVGAAGKALDVIVNLIEQKSAIARMMTIFWETPAVYNGSASFPRTWDTIDINQVSFSYHQQDASHAITDLNLCIQRGQKVGIVGQSGSGKSTLAKLLLGIYPIDSGSINFGSTSLYNIKHESLTHHVSTVLQETELFNVSVEDNITLMKDVNRRSMDRAIAIAQAGDIIKNLPDGLHTMIGEKGYKLSGGERQRIGLARAIYSGAEILILDEATSALDSQTELLVQQGLEQALSDKTLIIIAHRLSTLKHVDRIVVFDQGQIVEQGTFQELATNKNGTFAKLLELQHHSLES